MLNNLSGNSRRWIKVILICSLVTVVVTSLLINYKSVTSVISSIMSALSPVFVGCAFAFLMIPMYNRTERLLKKTVFRKKDHPRLCSGIAAITCMLIITAVIISLFFMLIPRLVQSVQTLLSNAKPFYDRYYPVVNDWLKQLGILMDDGDALKLLWDTIVSEVSNVTSFVVNNLLTVSTIVYQLVYNIFVGLVAMFYLLFEKEQITATFKKITYAFLKNERADTLIQWTHRTNELFANFIRGKLLDSLVIGIITFFVSLLINRSYAMLIAIIVGVTNIIPFFGPFIGAIPCVLILLMIDPMQALWIAIAILVIQQIDGNVLGPKILGDKVGISPLWIMISILVGGKLFGFVGMLLGVPVFALIYAIVQALGDERLRSKNMPVQTEKYDKDFLADK